MTKTPVFTGVLSYLGVEKSDSRNLFTNSLMVLWVWVETWVFRSERPVLEVIFQRVCILVGVFDTFSIRCNLYYICVPAFNYYYLALCVRNC
jgi:hypothetical protein